MPWHANTSATIMTTTGVSRPARSTRFSFARVTAPSTCRTFAVTVTTRWERDDRSFTRCEPGGVPEHGIASVGKFGKTGNHGRHRHSRHAGLPLRPSRTNGSMGRRQVHASNNVVHSGYRPLRQAPDHSLAAFVLPYLQTRRRCQARVCKQVPDGLVVDLQDRQRQERLRLAVGGILDSEQLFKGAVIDAAVLGRPCSENRHTASTA